MLPSLTAFNFPYLSKAGKKICMVKNVGPYRQWQHGECEQDCKFLLLFILACRCDRWSISDFAWNAVIGTVSSLVEEAFWSVLRQGMFPVEMGKAVCFISGNVATAPTSALPAVHLGDRHCVHERAVMSQELAFNKQSFTRRSLCDLHPCRTRGVKRRDWFMASSRVAAREGKERWRKAVDLLSSSVTKGRKGVCIC